MYHMHISSCVYGCGMWGLTFGASIVRTNIPTYVYTHTCT